MASTLRVIARLKSQKDKANDLRSVLVALLEPTRNEKGCISYELLENREDPTEFTFVEEWTDGAALDAHFDTDHVKQAIGRLSDLLAEELEIRRYDLVG